MMIYFVSFGSNYKYEEQSYQVMRDLCSVYRKSFYRIFTVADIPGDINEYAKRYRRGYGYWIWKPWLVRQVLGTLATNDIVLYFDGRCGVARKGSGVGWLNEFAEKPEFDIAAWQMDYVERHWTTGDLLDRISGDNRVADGATGQFAATFHAWRVNARTLRFASLWLDFMARNPGLCRDEPSRLPNDPEFRENRHDQSVFSLMLKSLERRRDLNVLTLSNPRIYSDNLLSHQKRHPT